MPLLNWVFKHILNSSTSFGEVLNKELYKNIQNSINFFDVIVAGQGPGYEGVCLGPAVVCGFLASCRKHFTIQAQLTMRIHLLKWEQ